MPGVTAGGVIASSTQINPGVVESTDIKDNDVAAIDIATGGVDTAEIANGAIINEDISASAAIDDAKLATINDAGKVSGAALTSLSSIPAGAGVIPAANVPSAAAAQLTSPARSLGTNYQNTSGKNLFVYVTVEVTRGSSGTAGNHGTATAYMDTTATPTTIVGAASCIQNESAANNQDYQKQYIMLTFVVPNNSYYRVTATNTGASSGATIVYWREQQL